MKELWEFARVFIKELRVVGKREEEQVLGGV